MKRTVQHPLENPADDPVSDPVSTSDHGDHSFTRHLAEMFAVMVAGMMAAGFMFMTIINLAIREMTWQDALVEYPAQSLLVIAFGMSAPMFGWMRHRGHSRQRSWEMAAVMAVPVIPFVVLARLDVVRGADCGLYCLVSTVGMVVLMLYRRAEYGGGSAPAARVFARFNRGVANPVMRTFAGRLPPFAIVSHVGRVTGRPYSTPAWAFRTDDGLAFALLYGAGSDWARNALAAGRIDVKRRGATCAYEAARLTDLDVSLPLVPAAFRGLFRAFHVRAFLRVTAASAELDTAASWTSPPQEVAG